MPSLLERFTRLRRGNPAQALRHMATLLPSFPHFAQFSRDTRLDGIRVNSAAVDAHELETEFRLMKQAGGTVPMYFDIKGRQLRVAEVFRNDTHLDIRLNHPIRVQTPTTVLLKAGSDSARLEKVSEEGYHLTFAPGATHGPRIMVHPGDSLHIRDKTLHVGGDQFTEMEIEKIGLAKNAGFNRWFLSYVQNQRDVDEFLGLVGKDTEVCLKIEDPKGLHYAANVFKKRPNLSLVAARGDLYVELRRPHEILKATRMLVERDPDAIVGSRLMLSVSGGDVPSCADFSELAWLYDIGYRRFMLCDELCLKEPLLCTAVAAMDAFRDAYAR